MKLIINTISSLFAQRFFVSRQKKLTETTGVANSNYPNRRDVDVMLMWRHRHHKCHIHHSDQNGIALSVWIQNLNWTPFLDSIRKWMWSFFCVKLPSDATLMLPDDTQVIVICSLHGEVTMAIVFWQITKWCHTAITW